VEFGLVEASLCGGGAYLFESRGQLEPPGERPLVSRPVFKRALDRLSVKHDVEPCLGVIRRCCHDWMVEPDALVRTVETPLTFLNTR
jgi:hypothetical protein